MREGLVETASSLGTGMKEKMSIFLNIRMQIQGCSSGMKEEDNAQGTILKNLKDLNNAVQYMTLG